MALTGPLQACLVPKPRTQWGLSMACGGAPSIGVTAAVSRESLELRCFPPPKRTSFVMNVVEKMKRNAPCPSFLLPSF